jgi:glycosyltransferase involved in cell wall biosynthesis
MTEFPESSRDLLQFSVVIATYNDWLPLNRCLGSLAAQVGAPGFEVIVVDDGSREMAPDFIREWSRYFPVTVVRQTHKGISAARNRGVRNSRGEVVVFVDADCKLRSNCLAELVATINAHPRRNYFQLRLIGDGSRLVGRAEELRLLIIQSHMRRPDGCIRYLNTAGFAMRLAAAGVRARMFDTEVLRAEDTLFLVDLMQDGELPFFVEKAVVQHAIPLGLAQCLVKDIRSTFLEARTHEVIASRGVKFRVTHSERLNMMRSMWKTSADRSIGRAAWFVLATRQTLRLVILLVMDASGKRFKLGVEAKS